MPRIFFVMTDMAFFPLCDTEKGRDSSVVIASVHTVLICYIFMCGLSEFWTEDTYANTHFLKALVFLMFWYCNLNQHSLKNSNFPSLKPIFAYWKTMFPL